MIERQGATLTVMRKLSVIENLSAVQLKGVRPEKLKLKVRKSTNWQKLKLSRHDEKSLVR